MNALLGFPRLVEGAARVALEDAWRRKRADNGFVSATISATDKAAAAATLESIVRSSGATLPPLSPLVTGETALRIGAFQHRTRSAAALLHDKSQEANQAFDQALVQAIREEFRGLTLAEAAHDGMWHFLGSSQLTV
ncbi:hypothetical protein [Agrococcus sp. TSP3-2-1]|uniref:hypothetical protein n=1 Tax=Agrococcus sp. TSP3-2-1 TaxID=2804583 RepID=UPI003CEBC432